MTEPIKPRALTYTEMMNGGRQQIDEAEHARQQELQQRVDDLEKDVAQPVDGLHQQDWLFSELIVLSQLQEPAQSAFEVITLVSRPACIAQPERFV